MSGLRERSADLFSEALLRSYVDDDPRFVERPWLGELVEEGLAEPDCRFLLLTGEPGAGKTALMAWLARRNPDWPRYFIRRDSLTPLTGGDAQSLLFSVGHQLAALRPGLFHPDKLEVVVRQHMGEISRGARAVAIKVQDLEVSPFYNTALRVEQEVGLVAGEVAGIEAGRLVAEERFLDLANLQYLALLDPSRILADEEPGGRIVVLVDALDEIRYAPRGEDILSWLTACPPLPANVRVVLTSRPDPVLLASFRQAKAGELIERSIDPEAEDGRRQIRDDLRQFLERLASEPAVTQALTDHGVEESTFVTGAVERADGNFQYAVALARGIDAALAQDPPRRELPTLLRLEEVPAGTARIYRFFLARMKERADLAPVPVSVGALAEPEERPAWDVLHRPLLSVLAVTFEPLSPEQLAAYAAAPREAIPRALEDLAQFLDLGPNGKYRLYHATFADFLTGDATAAAADPFHVDASAWHGLLAGRLLRANPDWLACRDDYALSYTSAHLAEAARLQSDLARREELASTLHGLVSKDFMRAKARRTGSHRAFSEDIARSLEVAAAQGPPNLAEIVRASLIDATLASLALNVPPGVLRVLAATGRVETACDYAALTRDLRRRSEGYREITVGLLSTRERARAEETLVQALRAAGEIADAEDRARALSELATTLVDASKRQEASELAAAARDVADRISGSRQRRIRALASVAHALVDTGDAASALATVDEVAEAARQWPLGYGGFEMVGANPHLLAVAAAVAAKAEEPRRAAELADEAYRAIGAVWSRLADRIDTVRAFAEVATAFRLAGAETRARQALDDAQGVGEEAALDADRAWAKAVVALALAQSGDTARAKAVAGEAAALAEGIADATRRALILGEVAASLLDAGEAADAERVAGDVLGLAIEGGDHVAKTAAFDRTARALADIGTRERAAVVVGQALASAARIPDRELLRRVWAQVGTTLGSERLVEVAAAVPGAVQGEETRAWLLYGVVLGLKQRGEGGRAAPAIARAAAAADGIEDGTARVAFLSELAVAAAEAGRTQEAERTFAQARSVARELGSAADRVAAEATLVAGLVRSGDTSSALQVLEEAEQAAELVDDLRRREQVKATVAWGLAEAGQRERALALAGRVRDLDAHLWALMRTAITMARADELEPAVRVARESALGNFENYPQRDVVLAEVAHGFARRGEAEAVLQSAGEISQPEARASTLGEAAAQLAKAGNVEGAVRVVEAIEGPWAQGLAVSEVVTRVGAAGELKRAAALADGILHPLWKATALSRVARSLTERGKLDEARRRMDQALKLVQEIGDEEVRAQALCRMLETIPRAGEASDAYTLLSLVFEAARSAGRTFVFNALQAGAPLVASLDGGEILWRAYGGVVDVETWWGAEPPL